MIATGGIRIGIKTAPQELAALAHRVAGKRLGIAVLSATFRSDRLAYFVELRGRLLARMAEIGRDPAGFEFGIQVPTGVTTGERREGRRLAMDSIAAGANHVVLGMPPQLGPDGVDAVAQEVAAPLREAHPRRE